jgi:hypothetical protein
MLLTVFAFINVHEKGREMLREKQDEVMSERDCCPL